MASLLVLNGPNLNMLGLREPAHYGTATLSDLETLCKETAIEIGVEVQCVQSNHEGVLIDHLHAARSEHDGVVLNAGAFTHTSVALRDAIASIDTPVVELHISNVHARESFRHKSLIAPVCIGSIVGLGIDGYSLAMHALARRL